jgi:parallel beta-helix repeat protein
VIRRIALVVGAALISIPLVVSPFIPLHIDAFYVSPTGNDASSGSASAPWRTLQKAADTVSAGATVVVHSGTYQGFTMTRSGTASQPITFMGAPLESAPVIDGTLGARVDVVRFAGVHDIVFRGFTVQNAQGAAYSGSGIRTDTNASSIVIEDNVVRDNQSWGINVHTSHQVTVDNNDVSHNAMGIQVSYAGDGTVISGNRVHDNDRMLLNTPKSVNAHDDAGGIGIGFVKSTGNVMVRDNQIWGNRAVSYDYGHDGSAFEIYGASNVTMTDNTVWDNEAVLETGTDSNLACQNNVFTRNTAYAGTSGGNHAWGLWLRCGANMLVANNTFVDLYGVVFVVGYDSASYSGSIDGLRIVNNIASMSSGAKIFNIASALPTVTIDYNLAWTTGTYGSTADGRSTTSSAIFDDWTGYQAHGLASPPQFVDPSSHNFRLRPGSPAIDRGTAVAGVTDGWQGSAPDMGSLEWQP